MNSKFPLLILAVCAAALMPLSAAGQLAKEKPKTQAGPPAYKWDAFAMGGYTGINQINQSRYGLIGAKFGVTRDFGRHFGITGIGDYYKPPVGNGRGGNPGDPSVYDALAGPEFRANLYGNFDGFVHGLIGIEHTGGEHMTPNISFAGGFGGGLDLQHEPALGAACLRRPHWRGLYAPRQHTPA